MRKNLILFQTLLIFSVMAFAQSRLITGQVKDEKGNIIPFASVAIKNAVSGAVTAGVSADANGNFKIDVGSNKFLVVSSTGFQEKDIAVPQSGTIVNVQLGNSTQVIEEVVVTALGIRRNRNQLGYAAQQISGEDLSQTRSSNFVSGLSGKVSGVEIRQGTGLGASTNVVIRGTKSLLSSNQAMFVVDGVPIDNSNTSNSSTATGGSKDVNGRDVGGFDYGNAAADINPDDIESLTVLKGAAASALYGSRAANGVVMITTKKGKKGLGITVNSGVTIGQIDKSTYAQYQKEYGAGYAQTGYSKPGSSSPNYGFWYKDAFGTGALSLIVPTTEDAAYGVKFDPNLMVYHWNAFDPTSPYYKQMRPWVAAANDPTSFFETAFSTNNSVLLNGGGDKTTYKLGYTRSEEKGILPNSKLVKNIVNFSSNYQITDKLIASASINFSKVDGKGRYGTGYNKYNVNQSFRQWWEPNVDIQELNDAYFRSGKNVTWNWADPTVASGLHPIYTDNPYWIRYQNYETDNRFRYFGNASLTYKATDWLNFLGRVSLDSYDELHEERVAVGSVAVPTYTRFTRTFREYNYDLIANVDKNINEDFNLKALLGTNLRRTNVASVFAQTNGGLVVPGLYALSNSFSPLNVLPTDEIGEQIAVDGYFAGLTLGYRNLITLDATARRDRSSTLPTNNNAYFYPSISASLLFSKWLTGLNWLSTGKFRANYAEVGNSAPWGVLQDVYNRAANFGSAPLYSLPDIKNEANLQPERTKSYEAGLELAFFKNRLGLDVTYYSTKSINQIIPVSVSMATGYNKKVVNAGTIQNRGIELSLYAVPVKTKNFSWNVNVNWSRNRNEVLALFDRSTNLPINDLNMQGGVSINATLHQPYGTIQGKTWTYVGNPIDGYDLSKKVVGVNGFYVQTTTTNNVIGNVNPDWIGGIYNTFRYKDFSLGFLIDVRQGGDVFSLDLYYGLDTGVLPETAGLNDLGNPSRNTIANGGGLITKGYTADGKVNTKRVENTGTGFYGYERNPAAGFVYDASYVKLRELNLTYSLPQKVVGKIAPFKGVDFSVIGRNLWIFHKNLPYADPEEAITAGNIQGYQSGAYPTTRTLGFNLKLRF